MKGLFKSLYVFRKIIWNLAKYDFRSRYLGSLLGVTWAFVLPLINLVIIWFALQQGVRATPKEGVPFILWLITGLFPWTFFSDALSSASNSIVEKSFLVKKIVFQVELLPFIKVIAALFPFLFFSVLMLLIFFAYGYGPDIYWLQIPYYFFSLSLLVLSISWLTSSVVVFYRDCGQLITLALQLGFWITPVFWSPEKLPERFRFVALLNPVNYIVSGYRDSLISKQWFWQSPNQTIYFWVFLFSCGTLGLFVFRKLRPHFADVL